MATLDECDRLKLNKTARAPKLIDGVVHVWSVPTNTAQTDITRLSLLLEAEERDRASRFRFEHLRHRFILARGVLRVLLGNYLSIRPEAVQFCYGLKGKPALSEGGVSFSASHSGGLAVFAFTVGSEIGVDVEQIRAFPDMQEIASRFFCFDEAAELMTLSPPERERAFFLCWTRKEAYIKATGDGLSTPLDSFRVTLRPGVPAQFVHINHDFSAAKSWMLHDLRFMPEHAGALAYRGKPRSVLVHPIIAPAELVAEL